ncbi:MAG: hypothetical protein N3E37_03695 [Candidatus Micrarchaeota archaeon]|nr:hypothetical protein [Candidatus Micrarchaeota archaeon]
MHQNESFDNKSHHGFMNKNHLPQSNFGSNNSTSGKELKRKTVICDSSVLVCLSNSALMSVIDFLVEKAKIRFVIPYEVYQECILHPDQIKAHAWSSIKIKQMTVKGSVEVVNLTDEEKKLSDYIYNLGNNSFFSGSIPITLFHKGELEVLALALSRDYKYIAIDERTTRVFFEDYRLLLKHLEHEFSTRINVSSRNINELLSLFGSKVFLRSSELLYIAYKKGYFNSFRDDRDKALEYSLYAVKYRGCSISFKEISELIKIAFDNQK